MGGQGGSGVGDRGLWSAAPSPTFQPIPGPFSLASQVKVRPLGPPLSRHGDRWQAGQAAGQGVGTETGHAHEHSRADARSRPPRRQRHLQRGAAHLGMQHPPRHQGIGYKRRPRRLGVGQQGLMGGEGRWGGWA